MTPRRLTLIALTALSLLCASCDSPQTPPASSPNAPVVIAASAGQEVTKNIKDIAADPGLVAKGVSAAALKDDNGDPLPIGEISPEDDEPHRHDWMRKEHVGKLAVGMPAAEVIALLGEPSSKGKREFSDATGLYAESWSWPRKGVILSMDAPAEKGDVTEIGHVKVNSPFDGKTTRGVGMGSSREDVVAAYKDVAGDHSDEEDEELFVVGDVFNAALAFRFNKKGKVQNVEMGQMAE